MPTRSLAAEVAGSIPRSDGGFQALGDTFAEIPKLRRQVAELEAELVRLRAELIHARKTRQ